MVSSDSLPGIDKTLEVPSVKFSSSLRVMNTPSFLRPFVTHIETNQSEGRGGENPGVPGGKPPDTPASRTWLVSHVASAGLEPKPDTVVR